MSKMHDGGLMLSPVTAYKRVQHVKKAVDNKIKSQRAN